MSTLLVLVASAFSWICFLQPLEGDYRGEALDGAAVKCTFRLLRGEAFIVPEASAPVSFSRYHHTPSGWSLTEQGMTNAAWTLHRHPLGFDLVAVTNDTLRYRFIRDWVPGGR